MILCRLLIVGKPFQKPPTTYTGLRVEYINVSENIRKND